MSTRRRFSRISQGTRTRHIRVSVYTEFINLTFLIFLLLTVDFFFFVFSAQTNTTCYGIIVIIFPTKSVNFCAEIPYPITFWTCQTKYLTRAYLSNFFFFLVGVTIFNFFVFFCLCSPLGQQLAPVLELFSNNIGIHPGVRRSESDFESLNNDIDSAR